MTKKKKTENKEENENNEKLSESREYAGEIGESRASRRRELLSANKNEAGEEEEGEEEKKETVGSNTFTT